MSLDRTRPFATVFGTADHAFSQDGKLFDQDGEEIGAKPKGKAKAAEPAAPAASDQIDEQLND